VSETAALPTLGRRAAAEALGTALLLSAVVGSGIMGERLFQGAPGLILLANSLATGAALASLILGLGSLSGAHFNPLVTAVDAAAGGRPWHEVPAYAAAQTTGAVAGVAAAHAMFTQPLFSLSHRARAGPALCFSEAAATFGLLIVVSGTRRRSTATALAVGSYIAAGYWFTSSTSFANPAVTLARCLSDSFVGIRPRDVPGFLVGELAGAAAAALLVRWLTPLDRAAETSRR
jgi:glycerol uptake facilitator-like aquaporin